MRKSIISKFLFFSILLLAFLLRFMLPEVSPPGLYTDEAAYGYNAYSILRTGKDEFGISFPFAFKSFGDYKTPLFIYATIPFIWLGGLTVQSIRYASATYSFLLVVAIYACAYELFHKKRIALLAAWVCATLPFALQFGRMAHENNLSSLLITCGVFCFLRAKLHKWLLPLSFVWFGLSTYAYHDARVVAPLLLVLLLFRGRFLRVGYIYLIISFVVFAVTLLPLLSLTRTPAAWTRPTYTSLLADKGIIYETERARREDNLQGSTIGRTYHNKVTEYVLKFSQNYFSHFSPDFLFFSGDTVKTFHIHDVGLLYIVFLPLLMLGTVCVIRNRNMDVYLLVGWFLIAPLPSSLTKLAPSAGRLLTILAPLSMIIAFGFLYVHRILYKNKIIFLIMIVSFIGNMSFYLHSYYVNTPVRYAKDWFVGQKEMMDIVKEKQNQYKTIWFSRQVTRYIFALTYLQYPPEKYQPQAVLSSLDEYGFGWVSGFDKYVFDDFPKDPRDYPDTLFIGRNINYAVHVDKPLFVMYYPDGEEAFIVADKTSFYR